MKRIAICCDGTWNSPDQKDKEGVASPTNHRPIDNPGNDPKTGEPRITSEALHESVLVRYREQDDFRPPQLVEYFDRKPDELPDEDD